MIFDVGLFFVSYFCDGCWVVWFVVIDENANSTRHQCGYEGRDNANIWHSVFQTAEALAEYIQQQRH